MGIDRLTVRKGDAVAAGCTTEKAAACILPASHHEARAKDLTLVHTRKEEYDGERKGARNKCVDHGGTELCTGRCSGGAALVFGSHAANAAKAKDLRIDKKVKPKIVQVGQNQTFLIKVKNKSKTNASNVTVTDPLPSKVKLVGRAPACTVREAAASLVER